MKTTYVTQNSTLIEKSSDLTQNLPVLQEKTFNVSE
jgi:hypothetical protein